MTSKEQLKRLDAIIDKHATASVPLFPRWTLLRRSFGYDNTNYMVVNFEPKEKVYTLSFRTFREMTITVTQEKCENEYGVFKRAPLYQLGQELKSPIKDVLDKFYVADYDPLKDTYALLTKSGVVCVHRPEVNRNWTPVN